MKKRLLTLALAVVLCFGLVIPASAEFILFEKSSQFGAWTWSSHSFYPADGIDVSQKKDEFEKATGLSVFSEEVNDPTIISFNISYTCYGLKDGSGQVILPADFVTMIYLQDGNIFVRRSRENGKLYPDDVGGYGIYAVGGKAIVAASYDNVGIEYGESEYKTFLVTRRTGYPYHTTEEYDFLGTATGMYDKSGKELLPANYHSIDYMDDGYYRIQKIHEDSDGSLYSSFGVYKYGVGISIPCQRDIGISYLGSDMFRIRYSAFCYGAVDGNNRQILPPIYAGINSYHNDYFAVALVRSQKDYEQAVKDNAACDNYDDIHGTGDNSLNEAYLTMGIVDTAGNAYTSFAHDVAKISASGQIELEKWNGGHEWYHPYANITGWEGIAHYIKTYDKENISLTALTPTGKTASDILRERGVTLPGMDSIPTIPAAGGFIDVKSSDYFADAVSWAIGKNITNGTSATTFSPEKTCTNAEILTFLWRAAGKPGCTSGIVVPFDLAPNQWYTIAILWATEKGMIDRDFQLDAPCTRSGAVKYIWQAMGSPDPVASSTLTDVPSGADYSSAAAWAIEAGVTKGTGDGQFSPTETCTRGQIVTFLHRAMG